jgi:hypothetical protein
MTPQTKHGQIARRSHVFEATGGALGALGGAGVGALAGGPPGAVAGALIGALMGASAGWAQGTATSQRSERDRQLDRDIGVDGGDIGTASANQPPAQIGALSAVASGAGTAESVATPSNGPIPPSE